MFTSGTIQTRPECQEKLNGLFKRIISAESLGLKKSDPQSYQEVAQLLKKSPNEILFIDDNSKNTAAAKMAGLLVHTYTTREILQRYIVENLN